MKRKVEKNGKKFMVAIFSVVKEVCGIKICGERRRNGREWWNDNETGDQRERRGIQLLLAVQERNY